VQTSLWTYSDHLSKAAEADLHQFSACPLFSLLFAKLGIADVFDRLRESVVVVAAVVLPAHCGFVREFVRRNEVLPPEIGRIHVELMRHDIDHALDGVSSFGYAE